MIYIYRYNYIFCSLQKEYFKILKFKTTKIIPSPLNDLK